MSLPWTDDPKCVLCAEYGADKLAHAQLLGRWLCLGHYGLAQEINRDAASMLATYYTHRNGATG